MLFRFSALTYNTHRIHYDHPDVTGVEEGYPGLVVHGPLLALLLAGTAAPPRPRPAGGRV
jgi:3-methylfumaryl-CoA hydratase